MFTRHLTVITSALLFGGASASATTIYNNDFTTVGSDLPNENIGSGIAATPNITGSQSGSYVAGGDGYYRQTANGSTGTGAPVVQSATVNLGDALDGFGSFTMTTTFKMNTTNTDQPGSGNTTFGLLLFSSAANNVFVSSSTSSPAGPTAYALNWVVHPNIVAAYGEFNFIEYGGNGGAALPSPVVVGDVDPVQTSSGVYNGDTVYGFVINGVRSVSGLTLTAQMIIDGVLQTGAGKTATMTDTTPLTGDYFGYRSRVVSNGGNWTIDYDNLSITTPTVVPEPASLASLGLAGLMVMSRRRR